jgi:hypothetical protein
MIDDEVSVPRGSDSGLYEKMQKAHDSHPDFIAGAAVVAAAAKAKAKAKAEAEAGANGAGAGAGAGGSRSKPTSGGGGRLAFGIRHFAGPVFYGCEGFVAKNKDFLPPDISRVLATSTDALVRHLFAETGGKGGGTGAGTGVGAGGEAPESSATDAGGAGGAGNSNAGVVAGSAAGAGGKRRFKGRRFERRSSVSQVSVLASPPAQPTQPSTLQGKGKVRKKGPATLAMKFKLQVLRP